MATPDRDEHTGLRLLDIWRYCRYTWSLPFHSQPGRRMYYLIRDASRDYHPIVGIGALGNSMVQIANRDEAIGWTLASLRAGETQTKLATLRSVLDHYTEEVFWEDLLTDAEVQEPSESVLESSRISLMRHRERAGKDRLKTGHILRSWSRRSLRVSSESVRLPYSLLSGQRWPSPKLRGTI